MVRGTKCRYLLLIRIIPKNKRRIRSPSIRNRTQDKRRIIDAENFMERDQRQEKIIGIFYMSVLGFVEGRYWAHDSEKLVDICVGE